MKDIIQLVPDAATEIEGISFSGQMHSLVLLNEDGTPLRSAILWNDVRTSKQCEMITKSLSSDLIKITKNKALEGFTLPKILWVQENEPGFGNRRLNFYYLKIIYVINLQVLIIWIIQMQPDLYY